MYLVFGLYWVKQHGLGLEAAKLRWERIQYFSHILVFLFLCLEWQTRYLSFEIVLNGFGFPVFQE